MEKKVSVLLLFSLFAPIALTSCFPKGKPEEPQPQPAPEPAPVVVKKVKKDDCQSCHGCPAGHGEAQQPKAAIKPAAAATIYKTGTFGKSRAVKSDADLQNALQYGNVVIDFWAPWCGPCKTLYPIIDELAGKYQNVLFVKINVDESPSLAKRYNAQSLPTLVFLRNGAQIHKEVGFSGRGAVEALVRKHFAS